METIPILDIWLASWLSLKGIPIDLSLEGQRVVFKFPASKQTYELIDQFSDNHKVPVLDFAAETRKLRSMMLSLKSQKR